MQGDDGKESASAEIGQDLGVRQAGEASTGMNVLDGIIRKVEAGVPFSAVKKAYSAPLDALVKFAGRSRDVSLLARLHAVISTLNAPDGETGQKSELVEQIAQAEKILQERAKGGGTKAAGIIGGAKPQLPPVSTILASPEFCEDLLRSHPSIGDREIELLKERGLLDVNRLINTDALELSEIAGVNANVSFEVKNILRKAVEENARQDVARRVNELHMINQQLSLECERIVAANSTMLANNKHLRNQYPVVSGEVDQEIGNFKELQGRVVSARVESNRLATETDFLKEEHQKLLDTIEEKHVVLDELMRRFISIRSSFDFVSGETGFAQDIMANVEGMLGRAMKQKQQLNDKIASTEASMEKLFSEFNDIVRKGKTEFYRSI